MTETRTPRLALPQWSSGTQDSPSREDFNEAFANLEKWAARFETGPLANRRAPQFAGTYYVDDAGVIYRDTGTEWKTIGQPKNTLNIVKETGTDPTLRIEVPAPLTADAIRTVHANNKTRFVVTSTGDVVSSSVRMYQSDTLAPTASQPTTVGVNAKGPNAAGVTIWGADQQNANLLETKTSGGANLTQLTSSGDVLTLGRASIGSLTPADAQFYIKGSSDTRPVILARSSNPLLGNGVVMLAQNADGTAQLLKLDAAGRLAVGHRNDSYQYPNDLFAINTLFESTNNSGAVMPQGKVVFRNTPDGYGVAGMDIRQEVGDAPSAASFGIFAGTSLDGAEAPERVRFGINPTKEGARFTASGAQWVPVSIRGAAGQLSNLLSVQKNDGTVLATIGSEGAGRFRSISTSSTDGNVLGGSLTAGGVIQGLSVRAHVSGAAEAALLSRIPSGTPDTPHLLALADSSTPRARINNNGTLEIGMDLSVAAAGAAVLTMRGMQYRQNGKKLQMYDTDALRWGSPMSAFTAEFVCNSEQEIRGNWVKVPWSGKVGDADNVFGWPIGFNSAVRAPFTGWYDIHAVAHYDALFIGQGSCSLFVNNEYQPKYRNDHPQPDGADIASITLDDKVFLNQGDTFEFVIKARFNNGFFTRTSNDSNYRTRMVVSFIGNA